MRAVIQRVTRASVRVDGETIAQTDKGVAVLLGVGRGDAPEDACYLAEKTANLRIFEDSEGKLNLSLQDVGGGALVVSQFTLYGDLPQRPPPWVQRGCFRAGSGHTLRTLLRAPGRVRHHRKPRSLRCPHARRDPQRRPSHPASGVGALMVLISPLKG